jgi:hypothetical protein
MDTFVFKGKNLIPMGEEKSTQDTLVSMFHTAKDSLTHTRAALDQSHRPIRERKLKRSVGIQLWNLVIKISVLPCSCSLGNMCRATGYFASHNLTPMCSLKLTEHAHQNQHKARLSHIP